MNFLQRIVFGEEDAVCGRNISFPCAVVVIFDRKFVFAVCPFADSLVRPEFQKFAAAGVKFFFGNFAQRIGVDLFGTVKDVKKVIAVDAENFFVRNVVVARCPTRETNRFINFDSKTCLLYTSDAADE